ncbi:MAG: flagellar protein FlgN [Roseovarius sp.]|nr:flagellar protein FlgN [Roseovarius sp.]
MRADAGPAVLAALDDLLERERKALLAGRFDGLARLLEEKTALIDRLNTLGADALPALGGLRDKAVRNQALFDGALSGIRRASGHVASLRQVRRSFETYDETGRRRRIGGDPPGRMEKRA